MKKESKKEVKDIEKKKQIKEEPEERKEIADKEEIKEDEEEIIDESASKNKQELQLRFFYRIDDSADFYYGSYFVDYC